MSRGTIPALDTVIRESLTSFERHVFTSKWIGREHEAISLYVIGYLQQFFAPENDILRDPTQICIQGTVAGVPALNPKGRVNKDLVIWPPEYRTCWDAAGQVANTPLSVMEWKLFRLKSHRPAISSYDVDWLERFAAGESGFVGYAVSIDLANRKFKLSVTRVVDGNRQDDWLRS